jgi:hypothetical protein
MSSNSLKCSRASEAKQREREETRASTNDDEHAAAEGGASRNTARGARDAERARAGRRELGESWSGVGDEADGSLVREVVAGKGLKDGPKKRLSSKIKTESRCARGCSGARGDGQESNLHKSANWIRMILVSRTRT